MVKEGRVYRPHIEEVMMETALIFSQRSTCCRVKAAAIIEKDRHIISTGYNGNAPNKIHCEDYFFNYFKNLNLDITFDEWKTRKEFKEMHHKWAIENELHAEMNAIIYAARIGISIKDCSIYTTHSPCIFCTKAIIHSGIKKVYYRYLYDNEEAYISLKLLKENGILVKNI